MNGYIGALGAPSQFPVLYSYTFNGNSVSPDISHFIVEVSDTWSEFDNTDGSGLLSPDFRLGDFDGGSSGIQIVDNHSAGPPANPGMPGDLFGLKINSLTVTSKNLITMNFYSNRLPVWGDFYAKGGGGDNLGAAYNAGFLETDPSTPPSDGSLYGHLFVPDSAVPGPSVFVALLGMPAVGLPMVMVRRWKRKRCC